MEYQEDVTLLIARVALAILFLWAGLRKVFNWDRTKEAMRTKKTPITGLALPVAVALQILGSLSLIFGFYTRVGALMLILFTIPATIKMHDFWNLSGQERIWEKAHFLKDVAIVGGLLLLILTGAGRFAVTE